MIAGLCMQMELLVTKALIRLSRLKFNSHHINVAINTWSTKCRLIADISAQIRSNLRDEFIKPN
jgi:LytS/YehU family sensor histidine kinase